MEYTVTVYEDYNYSGDNEQALLSISVSENFKYVNSVNGYNLTNTSITDNYSYTNEVDLKKIVSILIDDNFNYSNTVITNAQYLETISDNYQVNSFVNSYKEVDGELFVDDSLDCWVVNYESNAFSRYNNFNFNSFAELNQEYYGANESGIFKLGGIKDNELEIISKIVTGKIDVSGMGALSYVRDIIIYHTSDGTLRLNIKANDGKVENYRLLNPTDELVSSRILLSKGRKAVYWQFELTNDEQTDFTIEEMKIYRVVSGRLT